MNVTLTAPAQTDAPATAADRGRRARAAGLAGNLPTEAIAHGDVLRQAPEHQDFGAKSGSRKVNGYVLAALRARKLRDRLNVKIAALKQSPLARKADQATAEATIRYGALTGGQIAEANRLLNALGRNGG